jgi:hypothetical protein
MTASCRVRCGFKRRGSFFCAWQAGKSFAGMLLPTE